MGRMECMSLPINERKWMVHRFIQQKNKEAEIMEAEQRKIKSKSKR